MSSHRKGTSMPHDPDKYRDERLAVLETVIGHINTNLEKIDQRFEKIDQRFDRMEARFQKMDDRFQKMDEDMRLGFSKMNDRLWTIFLWIISLILATSGGLFSLMAHGFRWI